LTTFHAGCGKGSRRAGPGMSSRFQTVKGFVADETAAPSIARASLDSLSAPE
jgi:hypothetical protein